MLKIILLILGLFILLLILMIIVVFIADRLFTIKSLREVEALFAHSKKHEGGVICIEDLEGLPSLVQKWLKDSRVIGKKRINTARLKQVGTLRLKPEQPWMSERAEQYFTIAEPAFIWKAIIKSPPFFFFVGRDKYIHGHGNMLIKILSFITVANSKGPEMDQGTMLRYLGEIVWFPTAALSEYIKWEKINNTSAKATMTYGGISASGIFTFNEKGEVINFTAQRYYNNSGIFSLEDWSVSIIDYKVFEDIKIPTKGDLTWKLQKGDFTWFNWEITDVEYDKPFNY